MAVVDPHKRLYRKSGAYRAYVELEALPADAPEVNFDEDGQPYVQIAEHFCRFGLGERVLCGKKWASRYVLDQHLKREHGLAATNQSNHTPEMIESADAFYSTLMEGYEWPADEVVATAAVRSRNSRKRVRAIVDVSEDHSNAEVDAHSPVAPSEHGPKARKSEKEQGLELELRKLEVQQQMHAAELKALELKQELRMLKRRRG